MKLSDKDFEKWHSEEFSQEESNLYEVVTDPLIRQIGMESFKEETISMLNTISAPEELHFIADNYNLDDDFCSWWNK